MLERVKNLMNHRNANKKVNLDEVATLNFDQMDFVSKEAYKKLRANVAFSFVDKHDGKGKIVGVTSSLRGEGKSTVTVNLAYSMSQLNQKILLLEADLRLPSLSLKLETENGNGISDVITGHNKLAEVVHVAKFEECQFDYILAGTIPPNPSELLGSESFEKVLDELRGQYDYVIVDLPPISLVSDPIVVAHKMDGMMVVVRDDYCDTRILKQSMKELEFTGAKILGFVYNDEKRQTGVYGGKYSKYYKYGKYYQKYYGSYGE